MVIEVNYILCTLIMFKMIIFFKGILCCLVCIIITHNMYPSIQVETNIL